MQPLDAMSVFEKVSVADIPARSARRSKTTPLREAISALLPEEAFYVPYFDQETGEGFKPSTVAQVVGRMSKDSADYRYSVRSEASKNGCYIICNPKPSNG
ncbi:hypothetical protein [Nereida ignava]|uniref:hypothetical protein n=1 Tax=Nereida ignava TaxID=282199 RepID=UPI0030FAE3D5